MSNDTDPTTPTELSQIDAAKFRRTFANMPYSGAVTHKIGVRSTPTTVDDVLATLDALTAVLRHVVARHTEADAALGELRSQQRAMRAFLGLPDPDLDGLL